MNSITDSQDVWSEVNWTAPEILSPEPVWRDAAVAHLIKYFGATGNGVRGAFSGAEFNEIGGGGDRPEVANVITAEDIFAVNALSVSVPATHALQLLGRGVTTAGLKETHKWRQELGHDRALLIDEIPSVDTVPIDARAITEALSAIPHDVSLSRVESCDIESLLTKVDLLWREVRRKSIHPAEGRSARGLPSLGAVTVSKLLARKRPHLLPVIDSFIANHLVHGNRTDFYYSMWRVMTDERLGLAEHLRGIRQKALKESDGDQRIAELSELRVFDIVVWMQERKSPRQST